MDFNITNRVLVGFLLGLSIFLSYFFILDKYLLLLILLFITYDFYKIKVNIFFLFSLLLSFSILFFVIPYDNYKYLFLFEIFLIFCIFFNYKYKIEFFVISLFIFFLILFYIGSFDRDIFYTIIFISFFNDTLAYYFGKNIGGPTIVPKMPDKLIHFIALNAYNALPRRVKILNGNSPIIITFNANDVKLRESIPNAPR